MIENAVIQNILSFGPVFLLIAVRALAMIMVAPILSTDAVPVIARIALAGLAAFAVLPTAEIFMAANSSAGIVTLPGGINTDLRYQTFSLSFGLLLVGEAIIGIIIGFYMTIIFATFSTAGQFFSLQMGFGASETLDPLSQIENPLMGQYLNIVSMLVFVTIGGFHQLFLGGFWRSVQSINIILLIEGKEPVITMIVSGLSRLFMDAMIISLPILGTLFLTSLTTGLISKAAPQINILTEGFPVAITVAFLLIYTSLPFMTEAFVRVIDSGFSNIEKLYTQIGQQVSTGGGY
ncbi:MAG: flagellar biosynthetic protein FliR [Treponema sp.]|nr:flagellar biosynthetic protein FliR [Treponema sp.]